MISTLRNQNFQNLLFFDLNETITPNSLYANVGSRSRTASADEEGEERVIIGEKT
jgi:hypothetical protein